MTCRKKTKKGNAFDIILQISYLSFYIYNFKNSNFVLCHAVFGRINASLSAYRLGQVRIVDGRTTLVLFEFFFFLMI